MPQGIQIFDAAGNLTLEVSDSLTRVIGSVYAPGYNGSISVPNLGAMGRFWYTVFPAVDIYWTMSTMPIVTYSGTTLSWSYPDSPTAGATILYGVY